MVFWETLPMVIIGFVNNMFWYIVALVVFIAVLRLLAKKRNYVARITEIKEAPLEISNILKDAVKRQIIRCLRKERKYISAISKEINENAPRTRYHLKQLEKTNLVKSFRLAREAYFSLTDKGMWALDAINFYYPITNLQLIVSRLKKAAGVFQISKLIFRKKQETEKI